MGFWSIRKILLVLLMSSIGLGCGVGPDSSYTDVQPIVFPFKGQVGPPAGSARGTTVAMVVDSNYMLFSDAFEQHDLHEGRVSIMVSDPNGTGWTDTPAVIRAVIPLQTAPTTVFASSYPGATSTVVLFDMPNSNALGAPTLFPFTVELKLLIDGIADPDATPRFVVTGDDGLSNPLLDFSVRNATVGPFVAVATLLDQRPVLRLRGKRGTGLFESPGWIGGVEFTFTWDKTCIQGVFPFGATEAANGTAIKGPNTILAGNDVSAKIVLIDPKGFWFDFQLDGTPPLSMADETLVGEGPFLDLALNLKKGSACSISDPGIFSFSDFLVTDRNGDVLIDEATIEFDTNAATSATAMLRVYPVTIPPPLAGGC